MVFCVCIVGLGEEMHGFSWFWASFVCISDSAVAEYESSALGLFAVGVFEGATECKDTLKFSPSILRSDRELLL